MLLWDFVLSVGSSGRFVDGWAAPLVIDVCGVYLLYLVGRQGYGCSFVVFFWGCIRVVVRCCLVVVIAVGCSIRL